MLNSVISSCPNKDPCTQVINVKGSLSQKKINNEFAILQELIPNSLTDKGSALKVSFVPTQFKFDYSFNKEQGLKSEGENKTKLKEALLRIHYKSDKYQKDNLFIYKLYLNKVLKEQTQSFKSLELSNEDLKDIKDINIMNTFKEAFKEYGYIIF